MCPRAPDIKYRLLPPDLAGESAPSTSLRGLTIPRETAHDLPPYRRRRQALVPVPRQDELRLGIESGLFPGYLRLPHRRHQRRRLHEPPLRFRRLRNELSRHQELEINPNAMACILVVQGYSDLCEPGSLGQWMAEDDQLRSVVNQYLAPAGQRYWLPQTPANCQGITSAYWVRPVAQTRRKMDREKKMQDSHDRAFSP